MTCPQVFDSNFPEFISRYWRARSGTGNTVLNRLERRKPQNDRGGYFLEKIIFLNVVTATFSGYDWHDIL